MENGTDKLSLKIYVVISYPARIENLNKFKLQAIDQCNIMFLTTNEW